jgi:hypothetical protein
MNECLSQWSSTVAGLTATRGSGDVSGPSHNAGTRFKAALFKNLTVRNVKLTHGVTMKFPEILYCAT